MSVIVRSYPPRMGKPWEDKEVIQLLVSIKKQKSIPDIAAEHERTVGAINSQRRRMAADYHFNDKRSIEDIEKFTGLSKAQIEEVIKRHPHREKSIDKPTTTVVPQTVSALSNNAEIILILKDIQSKLGILIDKLV